VTSPRSPGRASPRRRGLLLVVAGLAIGIVLLRPPGDFPENRSTAILDLHGRLLGATTASDGQWRFPEADSVPFRFRQAVLAAEDKRFLVHPGIDPLAILRAVDDNSRPHRRIQGASTLTMQVARMLRRSRGASPRRTLLAKFAEAGLALRLEWWNRKETILSLWASNAPFGGNVVGLEAAAWRWYGTTPEDLTWGQCATLAAIPNAPSHLLGRIDERTALLARRETILARLREEGVLDSAEWSLARSEPLPDHPHALPRLAPHALARLAKVGPGRRWTSTLDLDLQTEVARLARAQLQELSLQGVEGLSVLVAEIPGGDTLPRLRAWIGDAGPQHVDLALAPRSTASTLKPFLYGLLLDQGRILPQQWLLDVPSRWGDYRPQNASGRFEGALPADEALARSLNVPWVRELEALGLEPFLGLLRRAGFAHLHRTAEEYGLPLILGGAEANLVELAGAYAAFARGGVAAPFEFARAGGHSLSLGGPPAEGQAPPRSPAEAEILFARAMSEPSSQRRILSEEASWLVLEALRRPGRIEEEEAWRAYAQGRPLAWKTGTSFGFRDAWTIAVRPRWVVAVWAGDPQGAGRPQLWGSTAAAPLAFRIQPLLPHRNSPGWFPAPRGLASVEICPETGWRRSSACPPGTTTLAPKAGLSAPPDPWHHLRPFDASGTWRVRSTCEDPHRTVQRPVLELPAAIEALMRRERPGALPDPPAWREGCDPSDLGGKIQILIPEEGSRIVLPRDIDGSVQKLAIQVGHRERDAAVRCFLDEKDLGISEQFRDFLVQPAPGAHTVLCQDDEGSQARARFSVQWSDRALRTTRPSR